MKKAVDNLCVYDPEFSGYAEAFLSDLGGSSATAAVTSIEDLKAALEEHALVKYVEVCLHGSPGTIWFANKGVMVGKYFGNLTTNAGTLQRNARVLFLSCKIAEGEIGDEFMNKLAQTMLIGKGGTIGATTVENSVYFPRFSFAKGAFMQSGGVLKVRRYDAGGNQIGERFVR